MRNRLLAFITDQTSALNSGEKTSTIMPDDQLLIPELNKRGFEVAGVPWDSQEADWTSFDACIIRSPWDYYKRFAQFTKWLNGLEANNVRLFNDIETVRWNSNKMYLRELERKGIPIVPTHFVQKGSVADLGNILSAHGWDDAVFKPVISASAYRTYRLHRSGADQLRSEFESIVTSTGALVQPFLHEVQSPGEWSLIFIDRMFSHAIIKKPKDGDFRSQEEYGSLITTVTPSPVHIRFAETVLASVPFNLLYARVDMLDIDGTPHLSELEIIEPALYFGWDPNSPERFAEAVMKLFNTGS